MKRVALLLVVCLFLAGCPPFEQNARDAIAAAKGFIVQAQENHKAECQAVPQCSTPNVGTSEEAQKKCASICSSINKAVDAQTLALEAVNLYCAGGTWETGGPCARRSDYKAKAQEALNNLDRIIAEAKGVLK